MTVLGNILQQKADEAKINDEPTKTPDEIEAEKIKKQKQAALDKKKRQKLREQERSRQIKAEAAKAAKDAVEKLTKGKDTNDEKTSTKTKETDSDVDNLPDDDDS